VGLTIVIIICITNLALGLFVLLRDPKAGFARAFMAMTVLICAWILSAYYTEHETVGLGVNQVANALSYLAGYGVVLSGLVFTYFFPVTRKVRPLEIAGVVIGSIAVGLLSVTPVVAGEVSRGQAGLEFSVGQGIGVYIVGYVGLLLLIGRNLLGLPRRVDAARRVQARMVLAAFILSAIGGLVLSVVVPLLSQSWHATQFAPLATMFLSVIIVYAVARHGLFDVRLAVIRTVAYILSLLTLGGLYYLAALVISEAFLNDLNLVQPIGIALALVLAFLFQPVRQFFDRLTSRLFYKDNYNIDDFFGKLNRVLSSTTQLHYLLERSATIIRDTLKAEHVSFSVYKAATNRHLSVGTDGHRKIANADVATLDSYVNQHEGVIVRSLLHATDPMHRLMLGYRLEVIMPLRQNQSVLGYLCLGEHRHSSYNTRDIKVIRALSDELIIAIQNALSVQEVRDLNATLQQRIDDATRELRRSNAQLQRLDEAKDEFISMASHQLRTPLTSIKGYISMLIEGDVGKVSPQQKHLLSEAFMSSERMVRLISDFLNVSRLQTGKFIIEKQPTDLAKVVAQEIDALQSNAEARNLKLRFIKPRSFPMLEVDEGKMRQVIMNFADNAVYYSKEKGTITISLKVDGPRVVYTVKDQGIGVPDEEKDRLFNKFFRATNARKQRPDGTGVGLFLAKKVIDAHDGQIIFESTFGKGSTFGFSLPLAVLRVRDTK
jgi:signal transduction histidine kinase